MTDIARRDETGVVFGLLIALSAGWAQGVLPFIGPGLIIAVLLLPMLYALDLRWLAVLLLVALLCSRLTLPLGAPSLVNYAHFGIFAILLLKLVFSPLAVARVDKPVLLLAIILGFATLVSALIGGWHGLRPVLVWLTLAEPFVLFAVLVNQSVVLREQVRDVLIALGMLQLPFAFHQFALYGPSDNVKGTLLYQGAGHHVLGSIGLISALLLLARGERLSLLKAPLVVALVSLGVLSDAKQLYGALVVGALPLVLYVFRRRLQLLPALVAGTGVIVWLAMSFSPAFRSQFTTSQLEFYADLKIGYTRIVRDHMDALSYVAGLGPGNGSSRVAMLTFPGFGNVPEVLVGNDPSDLVAALFHAHDTFWGVNLGSSVASPFYSFLGIFTDLGIIGSTVYLALAVLVWRRMTLMTPLARAIGQTLLLTALVLGVIYTWLDEPAFVTYLGAALAVLPRSGDQQNVPSDLASPETHHAHPANP